MINDLFEQLADTDVPPPPERFGEDLHRRVNDSLTLMLFVEFVCVAFPSAVIEFGRCLAGLVRLTLTGKYAPVARKNPPD